MVNITYRVENVTQGHKLYFGLENKYPGGRLKIKMSSYQYRDSHVEYKTVSPTVLSLIWEFTYLGKMVFILKQGSVGCRQPVRWLGVIRRKMDHGIRDLGPCFNIKTIFLGIGITVAKIWLSWDSLVFIMRIHTLVRQHIYTEKVPELMSKIFMNQLQCWPSYNTLRTEII